ncbi:extracellular matrix regulator RemB [Bacillus sp. 1P06AnD]|uniref:extracellular matrix regulator RemB n=1 Tax=Bacillus sp. 1P06AnD TaxID=3132208 RepID=UPI0039A22A7F
MYISIGGDHVIKVKDIIAILDHQTIPKSDGTGGLPADSLGTINLGGEPCKSIVITAGKTYLSPLSSSTLVKRSKRNSLLAKET